MWAGFIAGGASAALVTLVFVAIKLDETDGVELSWHWTSVFWPIYVYLAALALASLWPCCRYSAACGSISASRAHTTHIDDDESDDDSFSTHDDVHTIDAARRALSTEAPFSCGALFVVALFAAATVALGVRLDDGAAPPWALVAGLFGGAVALWLAFAFVAAVARCGTKSPPHWSRVSGALACCRPYGDALHEAPPVCCGGYPKAEVHVVAFNGAMWLLGVALIVSAALAVAFLEAGEPPSAATRVLVPLWVGIGLVLVTGTVMLGIETLSVRNYAFDLIALATLLVALAFALVSSILVLHADTLSANGVFWPLYVGLTSVVIVYFFVQCGQCWRYDSVARARDYEPAQTTVVANWEDLRF